MRKVVILSLVFLLVLVLPSFARSGNAFTKNEEFCFEIAQLARTCFDMGVSVGCEILPSVVSATKDKLVKKYKNPRVKDEFEPFGELCIAMCTEGEKFREDIRRENFTDYRDFILAVVYNTCMCECKKK